MRRKSLLSFGLVPRRKRLPHDLLCSAVASLQKLRMIQRVSCRSVSLARCASSANCSPIQSFLETFTLDGARLVNGPLSVLERVETESFAHFCRCHCICLILRAQYPTTHSSVDADARIGVL